MIVHVSACSLDGQTMDLLYSSFQSASANVENLFAFSEKEMIGEEAEVDIFLGKEIIDEEMEGEAEVDNSADKSHSIRQVVARYVQCTCILFPLFHRSLDGEPFLFLGKEETG